MMDYLRAFANNPQNPKNVQISYMSFLAISTFWEMMQPDILQTLSEDERIAFGFVQSELTDKKQRILNRQTYTAIVHAQTEDEKQAAYENYKASKGLYK